MRLSKLGAEIGNIDAATSFGDLHTAILGAKQRMGFDYFAFIQANPNRIDGIVLQDYPEDFMTLMAESLQYVKSPILQAASMLAGPFEWSELPGLIKMSAVQLEYLQLARRHGLVRGYTVPLHVAGEPSALISFVNKNDRPFNQDALPIAMYVANKSFLAGRRIRRATEAKGSSISENDARVITMLCRGYNKSLIAQKLETNVRHVNAMIKRGCEHYQVGTQTELVVRALYEQKIRFEDVVR
jgi:LuxR family transcriptional regulator, quorum-sensing system regulator CciR